MKTKDITIISILTAMSVVIGIIESYFTFLGDIIPGLKLGLANVIILFATYMIRRVFFFYSYFVFFYFYDNIP
jgi:uncharacterized membrane protein